MTKSSIMFLEHKVKLFNEAIEKLRKDNLLPKGNVSLNNYGLDAIQKAIDFGIERETPKLKADEMLSIKVSKVPIGFKVDVLRVKYENKKRKISSREKT